MNVTLHAKDWLDVERFLNFGRKLIENDVQVKSKLYRRPSVPGLLIKYDDTRLICPEPDESLLFYFTRSNMKRSLEWTWVLKITILMNLGKGFNERCWPRGQQTELKKVTKIKKLLKNVYKLKLLISSIRDFVQFRYLFSRISIGLLAFSKLFKVLPKVWDFLRSFGGFPTATINIYIHMDYKEP